MKRNGFLVGYGPQHDDSDGLTLLRHEIEPKWVCDGLYDPENVAVGLQRYKVLSTLPNEFDESLICGSDTSSGSFGSCPGDSGAPLIESIRNEDFLLEYRLLAVLHGGLVPCDNSQYPSIYTRVTTPYIWNWLMDNFINGTPKNLEKNIDNPPSKF